MTQSTFRSRRTATLLVAAASLAVGLVASPANAATTWESLPVPATNVNFSLLPFDSQNAYATTKPYCWGGCLPDEKLWQRSGSTWKELKPPTDAALDTLAGTGPNDLWAIGRKDIGSTVWHVHHYDGTKWSSDLTPDTRNLEILDAEAVSRTSLWGAGNNRKDGWTPTVTHWDGQRWNTTTFTGIDGGFDAIDVRSENDIWAVGYRNKGGVPADYQPLAMHYDGTKWSEVPVPETPGEMNILRTVLSNGPNDVWVASDSHVSHWDGATWTRRDIPVSGRVTSFANYGGQIYAGVWVDLSGGPKLLRWSGTSWVADTSLTNGTTVAQLATTPDGALYALSQGASSPYNYLSRLAPPTAR
ncbi:hypothetical protein ACFV1F_04810 [Streptomyces sp. NPDC059590]|uniref:hypothetical protein n=1 Tax=Streptomyces sp. NPDC059590 TaxID=3346877 RepID=UPI0036AA3AF2